MCPVGVCLYNYKYDIFKSEMIPLKIPITIAFLIINIDC